MSIGDALKAVTKPYERKARLYPAFLCLLPPMGVAVGMYGIDLEIPEALLSLVMSIGGFFLLANIAREGGKRLETRLYAAWGGMPTTQVQRHRNERIDRVTKAGHHTFLASKLSVPFPTEGEEIANPAGADQVYAAATKWLLEATRDTAKFDLLFAENIEYGYRRNALGLKWIAVTICGAAIGWCLLAERVLTLHGVDPLALEGLSGGAIGSLAVSGVMLLVWLFFFTEATVKSAAFAYADALFRACLKLREALP